MLLPSQSSYYLLLVLQEVPDLAPGHRNDAQRSPPPRRSPPPLSALVPDSPPTASASPPKIMQHPDSPAKGPFTPGSAQVPQTFFAPSAPSQPLPVTPLLPPSASNVSAAALVSCML